jgi:hypothetical protein
MLSGVGMLAINTSVSAGYPYSSPPLSPTQSPSLMPIGLLFSPVSKHSNGMFNGINPAAISTSSDFSSSNALITQQGEDSSPDTCTLSYLPQNPISSRCFMAYGPPADVLRKVTEMNKGTSMEKTKAAKKAKLEVQSRRRKWWIVLNNLRLFFYDSYLDSKPKLCIDLAEVEVKCSGAGGSSAINSAHSARVTIIHFGIHHWSLDCNSEEEAIRIYFSISESRRCLNCEGSMYMRLHDMLQGRDRQLGFAHVIPGGV